MQNSVYSVILWGNFSKIALFRPYCTHHLDYSLHMIMGDHPSTLIRRFGYLCPFSTLCHIDIMLWQQSNYSNQPYDPLKIILRSSENFKACFFNIWSDTGNCLDQGRPFHLPITIVYIFFLYFLFSFLNCLNSGFPNTHLCWNCTTFDSI